MRTERILAASAAAVLLSFSIFGAVSMAGAALPPAPTISAPVSDPASGDRLPTISGDGSSGPGSIEVVWSTDGFATTTPYCLGEDISGGAWSCTGTTELPYGAVELRAQFTSVPEFPVGSYPTTSIQISGTQLPTFDPAVESGLLGHFPTISGTGPSLGSVAVYLGGEFEVCTATVTAAGTWSCTPFTALDYGDVTLDVTSAWFDGTMPGAFQSIDTVISPDRPVATYSFPPASIGVSVVGEPGSDVAIEVRSVSDDGEGYNWSQVIDGCPSAGSDGDGGVIVEPGPSPVSCTFTGIGPGLWAISSRQLTELADSPYRDDLVIIPNAPTLGITVNGNGTITASGTSTPGTAVTVARSTGAGLCAATTAADGTWSCSADPGAGTFTARAVATVPGYVGPQFVNGQAITNFYSGTSPYSGSIDVRIAPRATVVPQPTPVSYTVTVTSDDDGDISPGDEITVESNGVPAGSAIGVELHSTPVSLGTTVVEPSGSFSFTGTIPVDAELGAHDIVVTLTPTDGVPSIVSVPITVVAAATEPVSVTSDAPPTEDSTSGGSGGAIDRNEPAAPNVLDEALATWRDITRNPLVIGTAAASALGLMLLVAFPSELLAATISEQYDRITKRLPRLTVRAPWFTRLSTWLASTPVLGGALVATIAAVIFGFSDPGFGFDLASVRLVLACGIALFFVGYVANALAGVMITRRWNVPTVIEIKPLGLILTLIGVVLSRVIDFHPGFLIGLLLGVAIATPVSREIEAKAGLIRAAIVFGMAMLAWVVFSIATAVTTPDNFLAALATDTLAAITAEGLTALFIGLLPFKFLEGESIFRWSKLAWVGAYVVSATAFILIMVSQTTAWEDLGNSFWVWLIALVAFALVAIGVYLYFRFWAPQDEDDAESQPEREPSKV